MAPSTIWAALAVLVASLATAQTNNNVNVEFWIDSSSCSGMPHCIDFASPICFPGQVQFTNLCGEDRKEAATKLVGVAGDQALIECYASPFCIGEPYANTTLTLNDCQQAQAGASFMFVSSPC